MIKYPYRTLMVIATVLMLLMPLSSEADTPGDEAGPITRQAANGGTLTVRSSTWRNSSTITATDSTLGLGGDWDNDGTISTTDVTVNLGGTFTLADMGTFHVQPRFRRQERSSRPRVHPLPVVSYRTRRELP